MREHVNYTSETSEILKGMSVLNPTKPEENLLRIFKTKYCKGSMGRSTRGIFGELEIMKN
jgi:hypothetical protein